jgi:hypothetical protein
LVSIASSAVICSRNTVKAVNATWLAIACSIEVLINPIVASVSTSIRIVRIIHIGSNVRTIEGLYCQGREGESKLILKVTLIIYIDNDTSVG